MDTSNPMTPADNTDTERTNADDLRRDYRFLMRRAAKDIFDQDDALELVHVCLELGRMGYTLTDETDWQPPKGDADVH